MESSTGSGSTGGRGRRRSRRDGTSKSQGRSADSARQSFEPRRDLAVPLAVELRRRGGAPATEYALNLSPGGLCLHLPRPIAVGETVELHFDLPGGGRVLARGRVIWSDPSSGASGRVRFSETGIRFEGLAEADRDAILRFVRAGAPDPGS